MRSCAWLLLGFVLAIVAVSWPEAEALAHAVSTGLGPFYDGVAHPFVTLPQVLLLATVGLIAGRGGTSIARAVQATMPLAWASGASFGMASPVVLGSQALPLVTMTAAGLLAASGIGLARSHAVALAAATGAVAGASAGSAMAARGLGWPSLAGAAATVFVVTTLLPAAIVRFDSFVLRIAIRVAGSWVAAIGILILTLDWSAA